MTFCKLALPINEIEIGLCTFTKPHFKTGIAKSLKYFLPNIPELAKKHRKMVLINLKVP